MFRSKLDMEGRIAEVAEILASHAGRRRYQVASIIMQKLEIGRRQATRLLQMVRERMLAEKREGLEDLISSLPSKIANVWSEAEDRKDRKSRVALCRLIADLDMSGDQTDQAEAGTPAGIDFTLAADQPDGSASNCIEAHPVDT